MRLGCETGDGHRSQSHQDCEKWHSGKLKNTGIWGNVGWGGYHRMTVVTSDQGGSGMAGCDQGCRAWTWDEQSSLAREGGCHCPGRPVLAGQCLVSPVSRTGHVTAVWRGLARHWAVSHPGSEPGPVTQQERSGDRGYDTQYATLRAPGDIVTLAWQCDTVM